MQHEKECAAHHKTDNAAIELRIKIKRIFFNTKLSEKHIKQRNLLIKQRQRLVCRLLFRHKCRQEIP